MKQGFSTTLTIIFQTFRDLYRERILYNVFFLALFLIFVGYLASLLVFGHQDRVMLHFGTTVISISMLAIAMTTGSRLIRTESEERTLYLMLSRPVSRARYFWAKATGVGLFLFVNLVLFSAILLLAIAHSGGPFKPVLIQWSLLTWVESIIALGLSLLLSMALRPGINAMCVLAFLFLSHNHEQMDLLQKQPDAAQGMFSVLSTLTPNGSVFFLDTRIYYDLPLSLSDWLIRGGYGMVWALSFLFIANAVFFKRNL